MSQSLHLPKVSMPHSPTVTQLFKAIPEDIRSSVLVASKPLSLHQHAILFEHGEDGDAMYIVQQGRIEISILSEAGRKIVLNQIPEGHCVGEITMVDGLKRTASAVALEDSVVLPVKRSTFMRMTLQCPQLAINLAEILCERLRWVSASVEEYALYSVELRLARRLLLLDARFADRHGNISVTQSDLAEYAGATRESANKLLMQWKADGLISIRRGSCQILDKSRLAHIAGVALNI